MELQPITFDDACDFIRKHHCDPIPPHGWKFGIAVNDGDKITGVITVGRPAAHYRDDGRTLEVTQCCSPGTPDAEKQLYKAALTAVRALGYRRLIAYRDVSDTDDTEKKDDITDQSSLSQSERATLNSVLKFPEQKKKPLSDLENLKVQLNEAKFLFQSLGHQEWVKEVSDALEKLRQDDFSFLENLWLKFARDVDHLILIAPHLHNPPLTEEQADEINGRLARTANETFAALDRIRETKHALISGV